MGWIALHVTVTGTVAPGCTGAARFRRVVHSDADEFDHAAQGGCRGVLHGRRRLKPSVARQHVYRDVEGLPEIAGLVRALAFLEAKANVPGAWRDIRWCELQ